MTARLLRCLALFAGVAVLGAGVTGCSSTTNDAATVTFGEVPLAAQHVSQTDVDREVEALRDNEKFRELWKQRAQLGDLKFSENTVDANLTAFVLTQLVSQAAADAEFESLDLKVDDSLRPQIEQQLKERYALDEEYQAAPTTDPNQQQQAQFVGTGAVFTSFPKWLQDALVERAGREQAIAAYYQQQQPTPERVRRFWDTYHDALCESGRMISHIQSANEADAKAVLQKLENGADFAELAKKESKAQDTAAQGGSLGCLSGDYQAEIYGPGTTLELGTPYGPVEVNGTWHVFETQDLSYEKLQSQVEQMYSEGRSRELLQSTMKVKTNPRYGEWRNISNGQGQPTFSITPPQVPAPREQRELPATPLQVDPTQLGG
jgi:parvulin-like peptidyl-prolyl isomerase